MAERGAPVDRSTDQFLYDLNDNVSVVLHDIRLVNIISQTNPLGKDWRDLAGHLNYTAEDVQQFERYGSGATSSCMAFLQDWQTKHGSTIRAFRTHLNKLERADVMETLDSVLRNEFDLVGVLILQAGDTEDITVPVHGKITLGAAFTEELTQRGLSTDQLELVDPKGTRVADYQWSSPAHERKGQQVTFRRKQSIRRTTADDIPAQLPRRLVKSEQPLPSRAPVQCEDTTVFTPTTSNSLSLHLSGLSISSLTPPPSEGGSRQNSIPLLDQLEGDPGREMDHQREVGHQRAMGHQDDEAYASLVPDEVVPNENIYESLYDDTASVPRVPMIGDRQRLGRHEPKPPAPPPGVKHKNQRVPRERERTSAQAMSPQSISPENMYLSLDPEPEPKPEWERLPGWHDLGANGAKKKAIQGLLKPFMKEDGHYILTQYQAKDSTLISVTFHGTTKTFVIKRKEFNSKGPHRKTYFLFAEAFQAPTIQALIDYYKQHRLSDEINIKLKNPV